MKICLLPYLFASLVIPCLTAETSIRLSLLVLWYLCFLTSAITIKYSAYVDNTTFLSLDITTCRIINNMVSLLRNTFNFPSLWYTTLLYVSGFVRLGHEKRSNYYVYVNYIICLHHYYTRSFILFRLFKLILDQFQYNLTFVLFYFTELLKCFNLSVTYVLYFSFA